jgi:hypothetical protein
MASRSAVASTAARDRRLPVRRMSPFRLQIQGHPPGGDAREPYRAARWPQSAMPSRMKGGEYDS